MEPRSLLKDKMLTWKQFPSCPPQLHGSAVTSPKIEINFLYCARCRQQRACSHAKTTSKKTLLYLINKTIKVLSFSMSHGIVASSALMFPNRCQPQLFHIKQIIILFIV